MNVVHVALDFGAIAIALEEPAGKSENFLDRATGQIIKLKYARLYDDEINAWRAKIGADQTGRYAAIPHLDPHELIRDMAEFTRALEIAPLRNALLRAVQGRQPLREFKEVLMLNSQTRAQWYQFKDQRMRARVLNWLDQIGVHSI